MRIAILHFHLRPGGVTRVIEMAWKALRERGHEVLVVSGEPKPEGCRIAAEDVAVVEALAYAVTAGKTGGVNGEKGGGTAGVAGGVKAGVEAVLRGRWGGASADVMHFHNHSLGKNFALPLAIRDWAEEGRHVLLQIHDFAENGRPGNYRRLREELGGQEGLSRCLYPMAPQVAYAMLNSADQTRLRKAGLTSECVLLPNPVVLPRGDRPVRASELGAERLIVYPTRAIRRKNIGEVLFWAASLPKGDKIVLTAAPVAGPDWARMEEWKAFAESLDLPVVFDGQGLLGRPTVDFIEGADLCLTTSVAEGFGMAFLEPGLAGCALAGRDLPGITNDFRLSGVLLDGLYERLEVPEVWAGEVRGMVEGLLRQMGEAYEFPVGEAEVESAYQSMRGETGIDFGRLDEGGQREVIRALVEGRFGWEEKLVGGEADHRAVIEEQFSLEAYGERLSGMYELLVEQKATRPEYLEAGRVLQVNLPFEDFFALRS